MSEPVTLDELSPGTRRAVGCGLAAAGLGFAALVAVRPESAHVPLPVLWLLCAALVLAGLAVALYSRSRPGGYRWAIVGTLGCMACVPSWIAFGPGARACVGTFPVLSSEVSCRVVFGVGAGLLVLMFVVALRQALACRDAA